MTRFYCYKENYAKEIDLPWLVCWDFNEIRSPEERVGKGIYNHGDPAEFIQATNLAQIMEMPSTLGDFT